MVADTTKVDMAEEVTVAADTIKAMVAEAMTKVVMAEEAMEVDTTITMEVDMVVHAVMLAMSLSTAQNKDWMVIMMQNLDQNILKVAILKSQWVMDQRLEVKAIMMLRLDQNQKTHSHQKSPIPKDLVVKSK